MCDLPVHRYHRNLRLRTYDYSQIGAYFITVCTHHRVSLFGSVEQGTMNMNDAGHAVLSLWETLPYRYPHIEMDAFIVMPNHIHGIVVIASHRQEKVPLGHIVGAFKSLATREYGMGVRRCGWTPFQGKLWQPNYFEHVIRDEASLQRVRAYIVGNPARWDRDEENLATVL